MHSSTKWIFALALLLAGSSALAQDPPVLDVTEELDFDDPEAWAMKYFASISLLTGLGAVEEREPGSVEVAFEATSVPHLDREQRTVGFGGRKEENLNRAPVYGRGRVTVGLPQRFALTLGWSPPVEIDGVEANLVSLALERLFVQRGPWSFGVRIFGQMGEAEGDFTCTAEDASFPAGSDENLFGCEAESEDEVQLDYYGLELTTSRQLQTLGRALWHLGVTVQHLDLEFQVNALTFGFLDRTRQLADGETFSVATGATWTFGEKVRAGAELFYSPLDVQRLGETSASDDGVFNLRVLLRYRLR